MPYSASAFGVLPPLWSRAAKKPRPVMTFSDWVVFTLRYSGTSRTGLGPGVDGGDERGGCGRPPAPEAAGRQAPDRPHRAAPAHGQTALGGYPAGWPSGNLKTATEIAP